MIITRSQDAKGEYNFPADLKREQLSVKNEFIPFLNSLRDRGEIPDYEFLKQKKGKEKFKDLDAMLNGAIKYTLECKNNYRTRDTNNVAVEFECYGVPSGLPTTKCTIWVDRPHLNPLEHNGYDFVYCICDPEALREFVKHNDFPIVRGGDDNQARMYLIPIEMFLLVAECYEYGNY